MSLEEQVKNALALLPTTKPKTWVVRPAKPRGGKRRHGSKLPKLYVIFRADGTHLYSDPSGKELPLSRWPKKPTRVMTYSMNVAGPGSESWTWLENGEHAWSPVPPVKMQGLHGTYFKGSGFKGSGKRRSAPVYGPRGGVTEVQSYLFPRTHWTEARAKAWAKRNGKLYGNVDVTDQYIRLRQADPDSFARMRTKCLARRRGICVIKSIIGIRR